jgi:DNA-binding transcriptional regulator YhcF (GntR family)
MILHVDPDSTVPPYDQIRTQIATMAATGVLPPGARLPTIRQLAADLGLAAATVQRAYRELERDGVVRGRAPHGTFVLDPPARIDTAEQDRRLAAAAHAYAVHARHLGADPHRALRTARRALDQLSGSSAVPPAQPTPKR